LLKDSGKTKKEKIETLLKELREISNMIAAGVIRLKNRRVVDF
jgi:hypothetical protein